MSSAPASWSVTATVAVLLVSVTTVVLGTTGFIASRADRSRWMSELDEQTATRTDQLAASLSQAAWNLDGTQMRRIVESAMADRNIAAVVVDVGEEPLSMTRRAGWFPINGPPPDRTGLIVTLRAITFSGETVGTVRTYVTPRFVEEELRRRALFIAVAITLLDLLLVAGLYLILRRVVLRPLMEVEAYAAAVSSGGNLSTALEGKHYRGELERLRESIAAMVTMLDARFRALKESEQRQREVFEGSRDVIFLHDLTTGRILDVNRMLEAMYGIRREDVVGHTVRDLSSGEPPYTEDDATRWFRRTAEEGPQVFEWRARRKDGSLFWVEVALAATTVGGETRILSTVRDVDARKRSAEENRRLEETLSQAQKMESVGRLAGGVAHDFNNMLMVILGEVEILKGDLPTVSKHLESVFEIERAALRSRDITRQLLTFSRKQVVSPRILDVTEVVRTTRPTLVRLVGEDVRIELLAGPSPWPVQIDPTQLDQVLFNLAANARDAMPNGGRLTFETSNVTLDALACRGHPGRRPGDYLRLVVRDEGHGMDTETLVHVFEPFFTRKGPGKGTGLGLATVYGIVTQSGGFLDVSSLPGLGTSFSIHFPRAAGKTSALEKSARPARPGSGTVLLVEDNDQVRATTRRLLDSLGYTVVEASGPTEAIALCQKADLAIDLLLTDVVMPEMRGPELKHRLLELRPGLRTLFMSGYTSEFLDRGDVPRNRPDVLQKPFTRSDLAARVEAALAEA